ncbi:MAG: hypothetical protein RLY86_3809 [Pseudomonadota bacterium]|jgi:cytochrome b561/polyisoprenoid-binding protein YceI
MSAPAARIQPGQSRYSAGAMALHWLTAAAIVLLLASGLTMTRMEPGQTAFSLYQWHKALGLTVLLLTLARIVWRLTHRPPALPDSMPRVERTGAHLAHIGFYALLIGLPLGGWAMVSYAPYNVPTSWFGLFIVPHLPGAPAEEAARTLLKDQLRLAHEIGGWVLMAMLALHVAAGLRHALVLKDGVFQRMVPAARPLMKGAALLSAPVLVLAAATSLTGGSTGTPAAVATAGGSAAPAGTAATGAWVVDTSASRLTFRGTQLGSPFEGGFQRFQAEIVFDPETPEEGRATVIVDTGSARTGDAQRDTAMPTADWFAVDQFPEARFEATTFRRTGPDSFEAVGNLTIRGVAQPVTLPFTLTPEGDATRAKGEVRILRDAFGVGQGQFATGQWVALDVAVGIDILARRP